MSAHSISKGHDSGMQASVASLQRPAQQVGAKAWRMLHALD